MKKRIVLISIFILGLIWLSGCGAASDTVTEAASTEPTAAATEATEPAPTEPPIPAINPAEFGVDDQYTFTKLFKDGYLPITCDALVNADAPAEERWIKDSESTWDYSNILKGTFTSNKMIAYVTVTITDASGAVVATGSDAVGNWATRTTSTDLAMAMMQFSTSAHNYLH